MSTPYDAEARINRELGQQQTDYLYSVERAMRKATTLANLNERKKMADQLMVNVIRTLVSGTDMAPCVNRICETFVEITAAEPLRTQPDLAPHGLVSDPAQRERIARGFV